MKKIKCSKCNYEWHTKSKRQNVSCPNCLRKTPIPLKTIITEVTTVLKENQE